MELKSLDNSVQMPFVGTSPTQIMDYPVPNKHTVHKNREKRRRKREPIVLPEELMNTKSPASKEMVKKLKNRMAAARVRYRAQQKIEFLEAMVRNLQQQNSELRTQLAGMGTQQSLYNNAVKHSLNTNLGAMPITKCECQCEQNKANDQQNKKQNFNVGASQSLNYMELQQIQHGVRDQYVPFDTSDLNALVELNEIHDALAEVMM